MAITITGDPDADQLLTSDPFALLVGMLLDQQFPMERAFAGPAKISARMTGLDLEKIGSYNQEEFAAICAQTPAIHRFPGAMAKRVQELANVVLTEYDGRAARIWLEATSGKELLRRLEQLPGFGKQKAKIFVALLAKQLQVTPPGWEAAAGDYALPGFRSVADVVDVASLDRVRSFKKEKKAAAKLVKSELG